MSISNASEPLPPAPDNGPGMTGLALPGSLGTFCTVLLVLTTAVAGLTAMFEMYLTAAFSRADSLWEITTITDNIYIATGLLYVVQTLLLLATGITFMALLRRMIKNGAKLQPGWAEHKAHWAITGWLVPFLNFVRPFQMVAQAWATSTQVSDREPPSYFKVWWGLFLAFSFVSRFVGRMEWNELSTVTQYLDVAMFSLLSEALLFGAGIAFFKVLRALIARQELAIQAALGAPAALT